MLSKPKVNRRRLNSPNKIVEEKEKLDLTDKEKDKAVEMNGVRGRNAQDVTKHIIRDNIILPKKQNVISAKRLAISLWSITLRQFKK